MPLFPCRAFFLHFFLSSQDANSPAFAPEEIASAESHLRRLDPAACFCLPKQDANFPAVTPEEIAALVAGFNDSSQLAMVGVWVGGWVGACQQAGGGWGKVRDRGTAFRMLATPLSPTRPTQCSAASALVGRSSVHVWLLSPDLSPVPLPLTLPALTRFHPNPATVAYRAASALVGRSI